MGDDDVGERGIFEQLFQPEDAFEVEVVGRLVEEEEIGFEEEFAGEGEAFSPAAGEGVDGDHRDLQSRFC